MVSFVGLVTVSATQKIYGEVYWNPPDLLMRMVGTLLDTLRGLGLTLLLDGGWPG